MTMEGNAAPPDLPAPPEIRVGQLYENPVTGERGIVRVPPVAANDGLLVADLYLRPGGAVAAEHVHPHIAEAFTVVRGRLQVRRSGHELQVGPGDRTLVAPGVAHEFWNADAEETHVVVEVRPGQRFEQMIRQTFLTAQDGRTDAKGRPRPLQGAMLLREFADTMVLTSPPPAVQKVLFAVLHPIARLTGHRAIDPEYAACELPVVDLEPLPPAIVERIPGLAQPLAVES